MAPPLEKQNRRFITGEDVQSLPHGAILDLPKGAIVTDIAREWIEKKQIRVIREGKSQAKPAQKGRIAVGSDHGGYEMKEAVKTLLSEMGESFVDYGTNSTEPVDYPDVAHAVALAVAVGNAEIGIVVDGAGIGSAMTANKIPGVRAASCPDEATARNSREHNDANVLTLGARMISKEKMAQVVKAFLASEMTEERHRRRVRKIVRVERKYYRGV